MFIFDILILSSFFTFFPFYSTLCMIDKYTSYKKK